MFDHETGHRYQESLRENPGVVPIRTFAYPLRGAITNVVFKDDPLNTTGQTLVDINLQGGRSYLTGVPISVAKANITSGEDWTPERGDLVVVQFLNGQWNDPVVTSFLNIANNTVQASSEQVPTGKRRYYKRCNKTSEEIDKDGNRIITVAGNETVTIKGDGKVVVTEGNLEIEVQTGEVKITVTGDASISAQNVNVTANEKATVDAPLLECTGNVNVADTTTADMIVDSIGSLDELRQAYLKHTHVENGAGGGTTDPPTGG